MADTHRRIPFIVDRVFPSREVHLIGGPSGSGKTRLMFQLITEWLAGKPVFGEKAHPLPFYYVSCDRSLDSIYRTLDDLGISRNAFPIISTITDPAFELLPSMPGWGDVLKAVRLRQPETRVMFLDGFATLAGEGKYHNLHRFLAGVTRDCGKYDLTVWGSTHATKMKMDSKIPNPRQRILGSVGWAGFCDTIITIEPTNDDDALDPTRSVLVLPRNGAAISLQYVFDSRGRLNPIDSDTCDFFMRLELDKLPYDTDLKTEHFVQLSLRYSIPTRTLERWLKRAADEMGLLTHVGKGTWKRRPKQ